MYRDNRGVHRGMGRVQANPPASLLATDSEDGEYLHLADLEADEDESSTTGRVSTQEPNAVDMMASQRADSPAISAEVDSHGIYPDIEWLEARYGAMGLRDAIVCIVNNGKQIKRKTSADIYHHRWRLLGCTKTS